MELVPFTQIPVMEQPKLWKYAHIHHMIAKAINDKSALLVSNSEIAELGRSPQQLVNSLHAWARLRGLRITTRRIPTGLYLLPMWKGEFHKNKEKLQWLKLSKRELAKVKTFLKANQEA